VAVMAELASLAEKSDPSLHDAPVRMPVKRLDETKAARELDLRWKASA